MINMALLDEYRVLQDKLKNDPETRDAWVASIRSALDQNVCISHEEMAKHIIGRLVGTE